MVIISLNSSKAAGLEATVDNYKLKKRRLYIYQTVNMRFVCCKIWEQTIGLL
jgi:hypothetical protein